MITKINLPKQKLNLKILTTTTTQTTTTIVNKMIATQQPQNTHINNNTLSTANQPNTSLCGQTKACGLFDSSFEESFAIDDQFNKTDDMALIDENDVNNSIQIPANLNNSDFFCNDDDKLVYTDMDDQSLYNQFCLTEDLDCEKQVNIPEVLSKSTIELIGNNNSSSDMILSPTNKTGKFIDKVNEQNLKIKMPESTLRVMPQNMLHIDDCVSGIITPNTYAQLFDSIPTPVLPPASGVLENTDLLLMTPQFMNTPNERVNPFFRTMTMHNHISNLEIKQEVVKQQTVESEFEHVGIQRSPSIAESVSLDHDYVQSPKKRKLSESFDEASHQSVETTVTVTASLVPATPRTSDSTSLDSSASGRRKKQRTKGIYRAQDITSELDLQNYLERRRKNNISSKQSRLSKKKLYNDMDEKSQQLETDNERLRNTITHLESLTKYMKDMLLQKIAPK